MSGVYLQAKHISIFFSSFLWEVEKRICFSVQRTNFTTHVNFCQDLLGIQRLKTCRVDKIWSMWLFLSSQTSLNYFPLLYNDRKWNPCNQITKKDTDDSNSDTYHWDKSQRVKSAFDLHLVIFSGISGCYPFQELTLNERDESFIRNTW